MNNNEANKKLQFNFWYIVIAILSMLFLQNLYTQYTRIEPIPYSQFQDLLEREKIAEVAITENQIYGTLKASEPNGVKEFVTTRVEPELAEILEKHNVIYTGVIKSTWLRDLLSWILPMLLFVGIWLFIMRRISGGMGSGLMSIGKVEQKFTLRLKPK